MDGVGGASGRPLAVINARLLDGRSNEPVADGALVVAADGRIVAVGAGDEEVPRDALVVDAAGGTLVPGLIDCHVHLGGALEPLHDLVQLSYGDLLVRALQAGGELLRSGITSARDASGVPTAIRRAFANGAFPGPRLQVSLNPISQTGGHGDGWTASGIDLFQGLPEVELPPWIADGVDDVRRVSRLQIRAGADWLKVMAGGGVMSAADSVEAVQYTLEELRAVVEEARNAGIHGVMAHAHGGRSIVQALRAGVRSIEHGSLVDDEGIDLLLERDVPIVPTFLVAEEVGRTENVASGATPPWAVQKAREIEARRAERFARAVERGVRIVMGSDLGLGPHHPTELALMVEHGLSPLAALRSATLDAARLLDLDADLGTLEVGKIADLALLEFDPLSEPSRWRDPAGIRAVIQGGRVVVDRRQDVAAVGVA